MSANSTQKTKRSAQREWNEAVEGKAGDRSSRKNRNKNLKSLIEMEKDVVVADLERASRAPALESQSVINFKRQLAEKSEQRAKAQAELNEANAKAAAEAAVCRCYHHRLSDASRPAQQEQRRGASAAQPRRVFECNGEAEQRGAAVLHVDRVPCGVQ